MFRPLDDLADLRGRQAVQGGDGGQRHIGGVAQMQKPPFPFAEAAQMQLQASRRPTKSM